MEFVSLDRFDFVPSATAIGSTFLRMLTISTLFLSLIIAIGSVSIVATVPHDYPRKRFSDGKRGKEKDGILEMKIIKNCKSNIVSSNTFLGTNMSSLKCQFWRWFSFCPRWDMYPFPKEGRGTLCIEFFFGVLPRGSRNSSPWDLQKLFEFLSCFFFGTRINFQNIWFLTPLKASV